MMVWATDDRSECKTMMAAMISRGDGKMMHLYSLRGKLTMAMWVRSIHRMVFLKGTGE